MQFSKTSAKTDKNLTNRISKFANVINGENTYRIPLRYLFDIRLINHPIKLDTKLICTLETDLTKLLKSNVKVANVAASDTKII